MNIKINVDKLIDSEIQKRTQAITKQEVKDILERKVRLLVNKEIKKILKFKEAEIQNLIEKSLKSHIPSLVKELTTRLRLTDY
jgi:hypothetical protein